jgi:hypothetical protein
VIRLKIQDDEKADLHIVGERIITVSMLSVDKQSAFLVYILNILSQLFFYLKRHTFY